MLLQSSDLGRHAHHSMLFQTKTIGSLVSPKSADSVAVVGDSVTTVDDEDGKTTVSQSAVIGTYALQQSETPRSRKGSALVVKASRTGGERMETYSLSKQADLALPGVLDVCAHTGKIYAACAENALIALQPTLNCESLTSTFLQDPDTSEILTLSLDVTSHSDKHYIATSHSTGDVGLYQLGSSQVDLVERRKTHDLEAWSVCQRGKVLYSGGDGGVLAAWSPDAPGDIFCLRSPHEGVGVTSVAIQPGSEYELWTGGYDDTLRVWDTRRMKNCVSERHVGGGVWRIKFHPCGLVLVATMYDGFKVVKREELSVVARYEEHKSIAYGAGWLPALDSANCVVALTASFYDCAIRLWTVDRGGVAE